VDIGFHYQPYTPLSDRTLYVDLLNTTGPWDGSVQNPFISIQQGIDAALSGDEIIVSPGTYVENINFKEKAIILMSANGREDTIIDGGSPVDEDHGSVVTFDSEEGLASVIDGFTVTNGSGNYLEVLSVDDPSAYYNDRMIVGGGILSLGSSPIIVNNSIESNHISYSNHSNAISSGGGGIAFGLGSASKIIGNEICYNSSKGDAGGIGSGYYAHGIIKDNIIYENDAYGGNSEPIGGGICVSSYDCNVLVNNVIHTNRAGIGGGINCDDYSDTLMVNNTFIGNVASIEGGGLFCYRSDVTISNSIFWNNQSPVGPEIQLAGDGISFSRMTIGYSDVKGGEPGIVVEPGSTYVWGSGMIDADPLFVNEANNDYHLTYPSPCRDMGDNSASPEPYDFESDPRVAYDIVDMGADEFYTHFYCTGEFTPGGAIEGKLVGIPGTAPTGIFFGSGVLESPLHHKWGYFYLKAPWFVVPLGMEMKGF